MAKFDSQYPNQIAPESNDKFLIASAQDGSIMSVKFSSLPCGTNKDNVLIEAYVRKNMGGYDSPDYYINHYYVGVDQNFNLENVTVRCFRKGRVVWKGNRIGIIGKTSGYYETRNITNTDVLFNVSFKSKQPAFIRGRMAFYEIVVDGYNSMEEFVNSDFETKYLSKKDTNGYRRPLSIGEMFKNRYICLYKENQRISNYVRISTTLNTSGGRYRIGI